MSATMIDAVAPVVSVVMAAYNGAALIGETLASLSRQSFGDFELIVVDDRSTDATRDIVRGWPDPRVRLIALEENGGPVHARNRAVAEARGRYIAGLDQDDICLPDRFARQVAYLDAHPDIALVGTAADFLTQGVVRPSRYAPLTSPALIDYLTGIENPLVWSTVMLRTDVARRITPFTRDAIVYAEDFDLYQRVRPFGGIARLDAVLLHYRVHPGSASQRFTDTMVINAKAVLAERHRARFGDAAIDMADLLVTHNMAREPVPDRATLRALGSAIASVQAAYFEDHRCDAYDRRLIRWETARRWGEIGRAGLRAGTIGLSDLVAVRPDHLGLGYAGLEALLWSGMIGGARRARRLAVASAPQTFAAKIMRPGPRRAKT